MAKKTKQRNPALKKEQRSASHAGFHYLDLYCNCPRKFFLKYICRLEPKFLAAPLICGAAFHEGKRVFYTTKSKKKALDKCEREISTRKQEFYDEDAYERDLIRFPILLEKWIEELGYQDLEQMNFIMIEEEIQVPISGTNGFVATLRPDLVFSWKASPGNRYIIDTKTSSHSIRLTQQSLHYGDQATMYILGVTRHLGKSVMGLIPDIAYWNKNSAKHSNIACVRGDLIVRTERQLKEYEENVAGIFSEMSQKVAAFSTGKYSEHVLFPRHTYYCMSYAKQCEYAEVCRTKISMSGRAPLGFVRVPKSKKRKFMSYVEDIETVM